MKNRVLLALALSVAIIPLMLFANSVPISEGSTVTAVDGKQIFERENCAMCHSVSTLGIEAKTKSAAMKGPDLVDVGKRHDAAWIAKYIKKEAEKNGKSHTKPFKGSDEELQALVDWLLEQKAEGD